VVVGPTDIEDHDVGVVDQRDPNLVAAARGVVGPIFVVRETDGCLCV
jgi:hypothetical protein